MNPTDDGRPGMAVAGETPAEGVARSEDPRLIKALEEYRALLEAGRPPDRHEFQARHPEIGPALADCLDGLEFVHLAAPQLHQAVRPPSGAPPPDGDLQPEAPLGDFRILREIGRGGMGVVYEAVQISLGRRVALKVLPFAAALDARQLQRFKNEAQAAGHLHHQSIVPVYAVGEERGVHYYAMQFIDGQTLAALIHELRPAAGERAPDPRAAPSRAAALAGELTAGRWAPPEGRGPADQPTGAYPCRTPHPARAATAPTAISGGQSTSKPAYFRTVANLGLQAAEALEHAHQLGVVHRDVKPANLMVDGRGNLWITDFGLAHCQSQAGLTMSGDLVGTLRYMSPEQALARVQVDQRTDLYSLGATLYELLTLEPALDGGDRQALLRQIAFEEPRPPRQRNRAIPRELETIVLKAMEKNAADRYASARELADDLGRYLKDEPIRARRPTLVHKVRKWARRHPGVVRTALVSAAVLLLAIAIGAVLANGRLAEEQEATRHQLQLTREAEQKAKQGLYRALVEQARASRLSRRLGQRFETLAVLEKATRLARAMNLPEADFLELRNETIACLALLDVRVAKEWDGWPAGSTWLDFDGALERYARMDGSGNVSVRRVADDDRIYRLPGIGPGEALCHFRDDGRFLAVWKWRNGQGDIIGRLQVWKLTGPEPLLVLEEPSGVLYAIGFLPHSQELVLGHQDGSLSRYDLTSGKQAERLRPSLPPLVLAVHPSEKKLAIACHTHVQIFDLEAAKPVAEFRYPEVNYPGVAWHPDGKIVAAVGGDAAIYLWDVATGKQLARLPGYRRDNAHIAFNHAGDLLASADGAGCLRLWGPWTDLQPQQEFSVQFHSASLRFGADDRLLAGGFDGRKLRL